MLDTYVVPGPGNGSVIKGMRGEMDLFPASLFVFSDVLIEQVPCISGPCLLIRGGGCEVIMQKGVGEKEK